MRDPLILIIILLYSVVLFEAIVVCVNCGAKPRTKEVFSLTDASAGKPITVILCALLPNENKILMSTICHLLTELAFDSRNQMIVSIVSPEKTSILEGVVALARGNGMLNIRNFDKVVGKHNQLNDALHLVANDFVYFVDADQKPQRGALYQLAFRCQEGVVLQGPVRPRDVRKLLGRVVEVETLIKYCVSLRYRSLGFGNVYFCGSNAVWPLTLIESLKFNGSTLVEDVEVSVRAELRSIQFKFVDWLHATELNPDGIGPWWAQRQRWAQGWLGIGGIHLRNIFGSSQLTTLQKWDWFYLIYIRRVALAVAIAAYWLTGLYSQGSIGADAFLSGCVHVWLMSVVPMQFFVAFWQVFALNLTQAPETRFGAKAAFALAFPAYEFLKCAVALGALWNQVAGRSTWQPTRRN